MTEDIVVIIIDHAQRIVAAMKACEAGLEWSPLGVRANANVILRTLGIETDLLENIEKGGKVP